MLITAGFVASAVLLAWWSARIHRAQDLGAVSAAWLAEYRRDYESESHS